MISKFRIQISIKNFGFRKGKVMTKIFMKNYSGDSLRHLVYPLMGSYSFRSDENEKEKHCLWYSISTRV